MSKFSLYLTVHDRVAHRQSLVRAGLVEDARFNQRLDRYDEIQQLVAEELARLDPDSTVEDISYPPIDHTSADRAVRQRHDRRVSNDRPEATRSRARCTCNDGGTVHRSFCELMQ